MADTKRPPVPQPNYNPVWGTFIDRMFEKVGSGVIQASQFNSLCGMFHVKKHEAEALARFFCEIGILEKANAKSTPKTYKLTPEWRRFLVGGGE